MANNLCRSRFIECYGELGEHLDEETWLAWLGIWVSAWREFEAIVGRLRDVLVDIRDSYAVPPFQHQRVIDACVEALVMLEEGGEDSL